MYHSPPASATWAWRMVCLTRDILLLAMYQGHLFNSHYTIKEAYEWLEGPKTRVTWDNWVWSRANVPKHSFIAWLIASDKMKTRDKWKMTETSTSSNNCPICELQQENSSHIFFTCIYSRKCLRIWGEKQLCTITKEQVIDVIDEVQNNPSKARELRKADTASLVSLMYYLWKARNEAIWEGMLRKPGSLVDTAIKEHELRKEALANNTLGPLVHRIVCSTKSLKL